MPFITLIIYKDDNFKILGDAAFIAGKKFGNAVWRNKSKRRLREVYKYLILPENIKILLIANNNTLNVGFNDLVVKCQEELDKINDENTL